MLAAKQFFQDILPDEISRRRLLRWMTYLLLKPPSSSSSSFSSAPTDAPIAYVFVGDEEQSGKRAIRYLMQKLLPSDQMNTTEFGSHLESRVIGYTLFHKKRWVFCEHTPEHVFFFPSSSATSSSSSSSAYLSTVTTSVPWLNRVFCQTIRQCQSAIIFCTTAIAAVDDDAEEAKAEAEAEAEANEDTDTDTDTKKPKHPLVCPILHFPTLASYGLYDREFLDMLAPFVMDLLLCEYENNLQTSLALIK